MGYEGNVKYYDTNDNVLKAAPISFDTNTSYKAAFVEAKKIIKEEMNALGASFAKITAKDGDAVFEEWFGPWQDSIMNKI